ncbi:hypothetical protein HF086_002063 [Spodoptera exigua]|uniref:Uncharacterized protein n=1 Tax=Spodoptera exigua TaxID=7107 RepID=A0A922MM54_SPOEX|nr:hypothetical protein HF086_002063 [Spodoptera exigua]
MIKTISILLAIVATAYSAEISSSYAALEKHAAFKPELATAPLETHAVQDMPHEAAHPVYRPEEMIQARARIEPVKAFGPVIKHDSMLSDQPEVPTEVNRIFCPIYRTNGYLSTFLFKFYQYEIIFLRLHFHLFNCNIVVNDHSKVSLSYDMYNSNNYLMEPDTSAFSLLWSQMPHARTMVSFVGRTITWILNSVIVLILGSLLTVGVCTYTNLCTIAFHGVGPIHEEMRALMSPERLEKISSAADFVKTAIDKYQKIQKVTDTVHKGDGLRRRRAIFNNY